MPPPNVIRFDRHPAFLLATACFLLTGCDRAGTPVDPTSEAPAAVLGITNPRDLRPGEAHFRRLAVRASGFGGYFYDRQGNLIVNVTGAEAAADLTPSIDSTWAAHERYFRGRARGIIQYRVVTHSFNDLRRWRDALLDRVFTLDGVRFLDLDEEQNRVAVGVDPERLVAVREVIDAWAEELAMPATALEVFESGPVERLTSATSHRAEAGFPSVQQQTLGDLQRPVRAGFQTTFFRGSEYACTIGWVTLNSDEPAFVTASHCSYQEGVVDDSTYYQHRLPNAVGFEVEEATEYVCGDDP